MNISVRLYASYRERAGQSKFDLEVPAGSVVEEALKTLVSMAPQLEPGFKPHLIAVNEEFANLQYPLSEGDDIALYPPVSGGIDVEITRGVIDSQELVNAVKLASNGAIILFEGTTRDSTNGKRVLRLEYEADEPMAKKVIEQVVTETMVRFGIAQMAIRHRIGPLEIGDVSLVVATGSPHRLEGFLAAQYAVDRIKHIVPVWKKEFFEDGSVWVGAACGPEEHAHELDIAPYAGFLAAVDHVPTHQIVELV